MEGLPPPPPPPPPVFVPDEEEGSEAVSRDALRVLVIDKGCGDKISYLKHHFPASKVAAVPEPTDDKEGGVRLLLDVLDSYHPHVLVAGSRGGKYAAELIQKGSWRGPTVLISAMGTGGCCREGLPIVVAHGTHDGTNPIHRVREDVGMGTPGLILLREFEADTEPPVNQQDHSLHVVTEGDTLAELVQTAYDLRQKAAELRCQEAGGAPSKRPATNPADARMALLAAIQARRQN